MLIISFLGEMKLRRLPMLGSMVIKGLLFAWLGLTHNLYAASPSPRWSALLARFSAPTPPHCTGNWCRQALRGRVMSMRLLVGGSLHPLGGFLGGAGAQVLGVPFLFVIAGLIPAVCGGVGFLLPLLKELDGDIEEVAARGRTLADQPHPVSM